MMSAMTSRRVLLLAFSVAFSVLLAGCIEDLKNVTGGHTGCSPEEITILRDHTGFNSRAWTASCRGKTYQCSAAGHDIACTESPADGPRPAATPNATSPQ